MQATQQPVPDLETLKTQARQTWSAGDYGKVALSLERAAEAFIARRGIRPGMRVLDVACGTGNLAIPAAQAGAEVVGIDIAPNLVELARQRAREMGVEAVFEEGDAEALAFPDGAFDLVVSMFGAMFAPRPEQAAAEMARVCRRGGRIAMANWTARGFAGQLFRLVAGYVPPPPLPPPVLWGDELMVRERFRDAGEVETSLVMADINYPFPPAEVVDHFREYFGPVRNAFAALPEDRAAALHRDLVALWTEHNRAGDGTTLVDGEYLEVVVTRA